MGARDVTETPLGGGVGRGQQRPMHLNFLCRALESYRLLLSREKRSVI